MANRDFAFDFETVADLKPVNQFYTVPGISFSNNALGLVDSDNGGSGNFEVTQGNAVMAYATGESIRMNINLPEQFIGGFLTFSYSSPRQIQQVKVLDAAGNLLPQTIILPGGNLASPLANSPINLPKTTTTSLAANRRGEFNVFQPISIYFTGNAKAIDLGNIPTEIGIDNLTLSLVPGPTNNPPTDITLSNNKIAENSPVNAAIGILNTTDLDNPNDSFIYQLVDNSQGRFNVVGNQLVVANGALLNSQTNPNPTVTIRTIDRAGSFLDKSLTINVFQPPPNNVAPTDISLSNISVLERTPNDTFIGLLSTTDPNANDTFTYSLLNNGGGVFKIINGKQLVVANGGTALNSQTTPTINIVVRTQDSGGLIFDKLIPITVNRVQGNPPVIQPTTISIPATNITGTPGNDLINYTTTGNTTIAASTLLANVTDPDGDLIQRIDTVKNGNNSTVQLDNAGNVSFTPDFGATSSNFQYSVKDSRDNISNGLVDVNLQQSGAISGGGGNDTINFAELSANQLTTTPFIINLANTTDQTTGDNVIVTGFQNVIGSPVSDSITGNSLDNILTGGGSNDTILGGDGNDTINGGQGDDYILGGNGNDVASGDIGNDTIITDAGIDNIFGGDGDDYMSGPGLLYGNSGNDSLAGNSATALLYGGGGNDYLFGNGAGFSGDLGNDTLISTTQTTVNGGDGDDYMSGPGNLYGNQGNDSLVGNSTTALLYAGQGNDFLTGNAAGFFGDLDNDTIAMQGGNSADGGAGNDSINASSLTNSVTLLGGLGDDTIFGGAGADTINGGAGNDWIYGGSGVDTLTGGAGNDFFFFTSVSSGLTLSPSPGSNFGGGTAGVNPFGGVTSNPSIAGTMVDFITDFTSGSDKIYLSRSSLGTFATTLSNPLTVNDLIVRSGTGAFGIDSARIFHDISTGNVYFNTGTRVGDEVILFRVSTSVTLIATDIVLF